MFGPKSRLNFLLAVVITRPAFAWPGPGVYSTKWCEALLCSHRKLRHECREEWLALQIKNKEAGPISGRCKSIAMVEVIGDAARSLGPNLEIPIQVGMVPAEAPLNRLGVFLHVEAPLGSSSLIGRVAAVERKNTGRNTYLFVISPEAQDKDAAAYVSRADGILQDMEKRFPGRGALPLQVRTRIQLRKTGLVGALLFADPALIELPEESWP